MEESYAMHCFCPQRKALFFSKYLLSAVPYVPPIMLCPSEDKEVTRMCPVIKVSSGRVIKIFTSNVQAKESGLRGAKNRLLVGRVWNFPKTIQQTHELFIYFVYWGTDTTNS